MEIWQLCQKIKGLVRLQQQIHIHTKYGWGESPLDDELNTKIAGYKKTLRDEYEKEVSEKVIGRIYLGGILLIASHIGDDDELVALIWVVQGGYAVTVMHDEIRFIEIEKNDIAQSIYEFLSENGIKTEYDD